MAPTQSGRLCSAFVGLIVTVPSVAGGAAVQRGAKDRVVPSRRHGDILHHAVAPAEGRGPVGAGQRPDGHGQELPRGENTPGCLAEQDSGEQAGV